MSVALITGASRGIGAATAKLAAARGFAVGVNYLRDEAAALAVVAEIERAGGRAIALQADVAREDDVVRLFAEVDAKLGLLTALVNNAGVCAVQARVEAMDAKRLAFVFGVNVIGSFLCAREALKRMSTRYGGRGGAIVNLSSGASRLGSPNEFVDYAATKGAIDSFTLGLAREVANEGVRVNAVRAGLVVTDIHASTGEPDRPLRIAPTIPMQRAGTPEEIAESIVWLLSPAASYVTGALLDVTGGR
ncbi:MAG TPA: SDR family oxidoreductase [Myxococcota bacterium]|nr:SDR family oxidoreductase [Myxococcota bacterium]